MLVKISPRKGLVGVPKTRRVEHALSKGWRRLKRRVVDAVFYGYFPPSKQVADIFPRHVFSVTRASRRALLALLVVWITVSIVKILVKNI